MSKVNFSEIAKDYEKIASMQKSASEIMLNLLKIKENDDVLDLGCGTGHLTRKIRNLTEGRVVGIDPSEGMMREAIEKSRGLGIQDYYDVEITDEYISAFREIVREAFKQQSMNGLVKLRFNRIFLVALK